MSTLRPQAGGRRAATNRPDRLLQAQTLAAPLPPLLVAAERVAATVAQGVHGRRRSGQGDSFWQFRRYETGDATARIDWRQSAKTQGIYIRQTEWEAAQTVWLWRDASPSMGFRGSRQRPAKLETAELLLLALAALLIRGGERIAALGGGIPPSGSRAVLERLAGSLAEAEPAAASLPAAVPLPRYGRLVLFGDFLSPLEEIHASIAGFNGQGVRGHLVQILDPAEETLPFAGRVLFEGMEGEGAVLFSRVEGIRDRYQRSFHAHQRGLMALAAAAGWTLLTHHTDQPAPSTLLTLYLALAETGDRFP